MNEQPLSVWLRTRTPAPPPQLAARTEAMLQAAAEKSMRPVGSDSNFDTAAERSTAIGSSKFESDPSTLLDAATTAMTQLLRDGCLTRESALDLLAVDALVTYAFEAAADDPDRLDARAERALGSIATLAEPYAA